MKIKLRRQFRIHDKVMNAGDIVEVPDVEEPGENTRLWLLLGMADLVEEEGEDFSDPERRPRGRPKGSYKRRDMRAEE